MTTLEFMSLILEVANENIYSTPFFLLYHLAYSVTRKLYSRDGKKVYSNHTENKQEEWGFLF